MKSALILLTGLALAASAMAAPASAQLAPNARPDRGVCWIEERARPGSGSLLFYAGRHVNGRYQLEIFQNDGLGQVIAEQSGSFRGNGLGASLLSSIFVGAQHQRGGIGPAAPTGVQQGNVTIVRTTRGWNTPQPIEMYGYEARLRVFDERGRQICHYRY